jgi:predicted TIM-barrel fold metal-dependent hydrolase
MGWVDADAHVVESPLTWDYLTPSEKKFRPQLFKPEDDNQKAHWVIDGKIRGLFRFTFSKDDLDKKSAELGRDVSTTMATRDLADVSGRVKHMDELGIDIQVLYTSIFLDQVTERADTEVALCGAYNRWMADVWRQSNGRLRWMATLPLLSMPDALDQLKFAKENGGCGVFMRPLEGARQISDPYFFPMYELAEKLNFCIGLHQANGSAAAVDMMVNPDGSRDFFNQYRIFNIARC